MSVLDTFVADLGFTPDEFQLDACRSITNGRGVLVCAPTGSGKTVVGEFAIRRAHETGGKCFYTTPIKALSNQKYRDLCAVYGEDNVGLLTGDISNNGSADIVVMTTEVLRNMIYAKSPQLNRLQSVVMDEIHYLSDKERGAVWEEVILGLAEDVQIVGLSATVSNAEEFANWLTEVRGHTDIIVSERRPVPLHQHMMVGNRLMPLFASDGETVNRDVLAAASLAEKKRVRMARRTDVVSILQRRGMLPAIIFIFSRAGCDGALAQLGASRMTLTTPDEQEQISAIIDAGVETIPREDLELLMFRRWKASLMRGFAAHHAGMLPAFRHIVEKLFNAGLLKVVFATETLALGINMPARTVVLERLVKYNGEAHVDLTPGQYTQMTGRAGRRGIDTVGNAVVQWAPAMDPQWVAGLASTRTYPLISTFAPGYNMAVNLLRTQGYAEATAVLGRSFAQYQADGEVVGEVQALERAKRRLEKLTDAAQAQDRDLDALLEYLDIRAAITAEERDAKRRNIEDRHKESTVALRKLRRGDVIAMPRGKKVELVAVVREEHGGANPRPVVVGEKGFTGAIDASIFPAAPTVLGTIKVPKDAAHKPRRAVQLVQSEIARRSIKGPRRLKRRSVKPTKKMKELRARLREHPMHGDPAADAAMAEVDALRKAQREVKRLEQRVAKKSDTLAKMFDRILDLLSEMSYVERGTASADGDSAEPWVVTDEGERLARIHSGSDLLVATCLRRGIWDDLDPAELAGAASALVFENRRPTEAAAAVPTEALATAISNINRLWGELTADEERHNLPLTKAPDASFAGAMHQWTAGAPLAYALAAAADNGAELTPGDFVRWCRQVIDLLEQVKVTGYTDEIRRNARKAIEAIRRGVVALYNG
ncbi:DEAD/DEAH box helicase [Corynebacterium sp. TAE3-ERU12]|uniref:DEAD/DEAH box helicase n=1 Tax=Corynebacterium sp. TAE3-ERU12 TaxID=2849491 RepID=UPI001C4596C5|nr:DEAD/DEAH box helicase [Corynebacterium sp. TAE3-ERU12]MBV7295478.1 DEAD/DEAH box helicase [Corynebacterium sp. TAE3-ERU12]